MFLGPILNRAAGQAPSLRWKSSGTAVKTGQQEKTSLHRSLTGVVCDTQTGGSGGALVTTSRLPLIAAAAR